MVLEFRHRAEVELGAGELRRWTGVDSGAVGFDDRKHRRGAGPMHIDRYSFGRIVIDGEASTRDVSIVDDRTVTPSWRSAGGHVDAREDCGELTAVAPDVAVAGLGRFRRVRVTDALRRELEEAGTEVVPARTPAAVEEFNRIAADGRWVAAAFHLTC